MIETRFFEGHNSLKQFLNESPSNCYTFTSRVTQTQLISWFRSKICDAKSNYEKSISEALSNLKTNLQTCIKNDTVLGADESDVVNEGDNIQMKLKDGTRLLKCPIQNCKTSAYKLKRHISDIHKTLDEYQTQFALNLAQKMERNKGEDNI